MNKELMELLRDKKKMNNLYKVIGKELKKDEKKYKEYVKKYFKKDLNFIEKYTESGKWLDSEDILYNENKFKKLNSLNLFLKHLEVISKNKFKELYNPFPNFKIYFKKNNKLFCIRVVVGQGTSIQVFKVIDDTFLIEGLYDNKIIDFDKEEK